MRRKLFIRFHSQSDRVSWVSTDSTVEGPATVKVGTLTEAATMSAGAKVTVILPASDVLLTSVNLPATNRRRMLSALPFALEDQLVDDVGDLHFALGTREKNGTVSAAVVALAKMREWITRLSAAGIQPDLLLPETLALPYAQGQWTLLLEDGAAVLRTGPYSGLAIDPQNATDMLPLLVEGMDDARPERMFIADARTTPQPDQQWLPDTPQETLVVTEPAVTIMAGTIDERHPLNLLQGDFSQREQLGKLWRPWRPAAAMLGAWFVLSVVAAIIEKRQLEAQAMALYQQAQEIYKQTFPGARRAPPDPRSGMESKLKELKSGGGSGLDFTALLGEAANVFVATQATEFDHLTYRGGVLNVSLTISDLQRLDQLKQKLTEAGFAIDIQSATAKGDKVEAIMQLGRKT